MAEGGDIDLYGDDLDQEFPPVSTMILMYLFLA